MRAAGAVPSAAGRRRRRPLRRADDARHRRRSRTHAAKQDAATASPVIGPPYFTLDEPALLCALRRRGANACAPAAVLRLRVRVRERVRRSPPDRRSRALRDRAPNLAGLKVSNRALGLRSGRTCSRGLDVFVGAGGARRAGARAWRSGRRVGARERLPGEVAAPSTRGLHADLAARTLERFPFGMRRAKSHRCRRGRADPRGRARGRCGRSPPKSETELDAVARRQNRRSRRRCDRASVAYHLALLGADDVVLADVARDRVAGATGRRWAACGSSSRRRPRCLARAGVDRRSSSELGTPFFRPGRLPLPRDDQRRGSTRLRSAPSCSGGLGVPVEDGRRRREVRGTCARTTCSARSICREDGVADPPARHARGRASRGRARGATCASTNRTRATLDARQCSSIACGWQSARAAARSCRSGRSCASSSTSGRVDALAADAADGRRRGDRRSTSAAATRACGSRIASRRRGGRADQVVDDALVDGCGASASRIATRPPPARRSSARGPASTT